MTDRLPIRRALLSVSDKSGLVEFAQALAAHGTELLSTGGTAKASSVALPTTPSSASACRRWKARTASCSVAS